MSSWSIRSCFHWCKIYENRSRNARLIVEKLLASFFPDTVYMKDHAQPGWTTSRRGQDFSWKSQSEWQSTEINGESIFMVWPTLGSRTAEEQNKKLCSCWGQDLEQFADWSSTPSTVNRDIRTETETVGYLFKCHKRIWRSFYRAIYKSTHYNIFQLVEYNKKSKMHVRICNRW